MQQWIGLLARLLVGGVWTVAAALKLGDPGSMVIAVRGYELLPEFLVPAVGHALPLVELVVGLCLLAGAFTRPAALASVLLFAVFTIGLASVWARGIEIDCGCFGGGGAQEGALSGYPLEIARDLGLLLVSAWLALRPDTARSVDGWRRTPTVAQDFEHDPS